jgi:hypothetical protein
MIISIAVFENWESAFKTSKLFSQKQKIDIDIIPSKDLSIYSGNQQLENEKKLAVYITKKELIDNYLFQIKNNAYLVIGKILEDQMNYFKYCCNQNQARGITFLKNAKNTK